MRSSWSGGDAIEESVDALDHEALGQKIDVLNQLPNARVARLIMTLRTPGLS
jgi:hypothetical protein